MATRRASRLEFTVASDPDRGAEERLLAAAAEVLLVHFRNGDGCCAGCLACWGRLVAIERCTQVEWAEAVRKVYGRTAK
jgi:hypothetical protein